jgi:hypothetical protein
LSAPLVFASSTGSPLAQSNFRRVWLPALAAVGLEGIHLHDLRHTGNQLTANAGANPKELMARNCWFPGQRWFPSGWLQLNASGFRSVLARGWHDMMASLPGD